ncbi:glucan phosphoethanolaminetransferase (alkaline phosphatase superfamily) [Aquimarina sp. EL_43]|uniref:DUF4386 domain-containing protein n=1 Tax=unclassified Aquimarina TaxID=2627091 RepID=UPI0018C96E79|nr:MULTISPECIES: DUF4386 domain-containing protein [unclassified Aquimarina]MBG6128967.1 glucan phosphoethanolaminetransferase (alkaline phosphatase superfamily) [Aquimarina sp. EL_35]MBG6150031.1 glucan phosphoethanolaminetransferase (alkaline phosphatase superfamily) [Aquimarina sp. EL_32]MBG6167282.1 glucan phosphoethanolaminetransferase (alkaline phosphatase superfamily) [Aquimarina sp. EL_43]
MSIEKKNARIAGLLYIISTFPMAFTELYVRSKLIVWGDAAATANNIINSKSLYSIGFVCDVVGSTLFLLVPLALYKLLKHVNKEYATLMVILALISVPMMAINMINHATVLELLRDVDYLNAFKPDQLHALMMISLDAHGTGYLIAQIFFGLWLLPLGLLVYKSKVIPRILGILLVAASVCYLIQFVTIFIFPNYGSIINPIVNTVVGIAELGLMFWLVIIGVKNRKVNLHDLN